MDKRQQGQGLGGSARLVRRFETLVVVTIKPKQRTAMSGCAHDSMSGDEGPILELGRMPTRWRCDECGATVYDPNVSDVGPLDEYRGQ